MAEIFVVLLLAHLLLGYACSSLLFYIPKWGAFLFFVADTLLCCLLLIDCWQSISTVGVVFTILFWLLANLTLFMHTDNTVYEMREVKNCHLCYKDGTRMNVIRGLIDCDGQPLEVFLENKHLTEDALKQNPTLPVRLLGRRNGSWVVELADKKSAS